MLLYRLNAQLHYELDIDGSGRFGLTFPSYAAMRQAVSVEYGLTNDPKLARY